MTSNASRCKADPIVQTDFYAPQCERVLPLLGRILIDYSGEASASRGAGRVAPGLSLTGWVILLPDRHCRRADGPQRLMRALMVVKIEVASPPWARVPRRSIVVPRDFLKYLTDHHSRLVKILSNSHPRWSWPRCMGYSAAICMTVFSSLKHLQYHLRFDGGRILFWLCHDVSCVTLDPPKICLDSGVHYRSTI